MTYVEHGHLGGYTPGGDPATYYPDLWRWLVETQGVGRVLDIGCGDGVAIDFFRSLGADVTGVEGTPQDHTCIVQWDVTAEHRWGPTGCDLVWCCEFVEHVEERYLPNWLDYLCATPLVLMTHAEPGQAGYHHVNCQPADYWIGVMAAKGFHLDREMTQTTRALASVNTNPYNHYRRSGLAFRGEPVTAR